MMNKVITELGVEVNLASDHLSPDRTPTFYNPKMQKNRMLVLCALTAALKERPAERGKAKEKKKMKCLDAFGATGIMGLQWLVHHHGDVSVTILDVNPASVVNIKRNCALNGVCVSGCRSQTEGEWKARRSTTPRSDDRSRAESSGDGDDRLQPGDEPNPLADDGLKEEERLGEKQDGAADAEEEKAMERPQSQTGCNRQKEEARHEEPVHIARDLDEPRESSHPGRGRTVNVICSDANVVMRQRFYDYIHLDPYGCATPFMDSAFSNVGNHGVITITSTDTAALYGKCPQVTLRNYGGRVAKCEYLRELAARLIVASAVRAAARSNKGLEVLLTAALEHFVLVILRVRRGAGQADRSMGLVRHLIHCQSCGRRSFVPSTLSVPGSLYQFLECSCQQGAPGKTAVLLGPVWSGDVYDAGFVRGMEEAGRELGLGRKEMQLLATLREEAVCARGGPTRDGPPRYPSCPDSGSEGAASLVHPGSKPGDGHPEDCRDGKLPKKRTSSNVTGGDGGGGDPDEEAAAKRRKLGEGSSGGQPAFYFSIPRHGIKDMNPPRVNKLIECLHREGFRASRTHFDPEGVRTSAGLAEFEAVLRANSTPTKK